VNALADKSGTPLTRQHQFPIYIDHAEYRRRVEVEHGKGKGPLAGLKYGLDVIEQVQPHNTKPNPRADPLWHVHRFSNADKHRELTAFWTPPGVGSMDVRVAPASTVIREREETTTLPQWEPNREYEMLRLRFDRPYPTEVRVEANVSVDPLFATPPFGGEPGLAIEIGLFDEARVHVSMVLDLFKAL
jgi:hypothetical protein